MLVLTRKLGETLSIDGTIEVSVLAVSGNRIKLGIKAPRTVSVQRGELPPASETVPATDADAFGPHASGAERRRVSRRNPAA